MVDAFQLEKLDCDEQKSYNRSGDLQKMKKKFKKFQKKIF